MPEAITAQIERATYHTPENGFAVLRVKVEARRDLAMATVVGHVTGIGALIVCRSARATVAPWMSRRASWAS